MNIEVTKPAICLQDRLDVEEQPVKTASVWPALALLGGVIGLTTLAVAPDSPSEEELSAPVREPVASSLPIFILVDAPLNQVRPLGANNILLHKPVYFSRTDKAPDDPTSIVCISLKRVGSGLYVHHPGGHMREGYWKTALDLSRILHCSLQTAETLTQQLPQEHQISRGIDILTASFKDMPLQDWSPT